MTFALKYQSVPGYAYDTLSLYLVFLNCLEGREGTLILGDVQSLSNQEKLGLQWKRHFVNDTL